MTSTERHDIAEGANRIIDSVSDAEQAALEAVRRFVDTVDSAFADVSQDGPRRKVIDSAFKMTEQLLGTTNELARKVVAAGSSALASRETAEPTKGGPKQSEPVR
jgi:hypothetical protein